MQTATVRFFEALLIDVPFLVKATLVAMLACLCAFINLTTHAVTEETIFYAVLFPMPATPFQSDPINQIKLLLTLTAILHLISLDAAGVM